jgi:hypothetical protein
VRTRFFPPLAAGCRLIQALGFSMSIVAIRHAEPSDFDVICELNLSQVQHTSQMDVSRLTELHRIASYHKVACVNGKVSAFLLAMRHDAAYENANFEWFLGKFPNFIYIDRVVVSVQSRGLSLGSKLYDDIFNHARSEGISTIVCEYNLVPPNEPSRRFHDKYGFREQGTQWLDSGRKHVSLQAAKT